MNKKVELLQIIQRLVFHTFGKVAFGERFEITQELHEAVSAVIEYIAEHFRVPMEFLWPYLDKYQPGEDAKKYINNLIMNVCSFRLGLWERSVASKSVETKSP